MKKNKEKNQPVKKLVVKGLPTVEQMRAGQAMRTGQRQQMQGAQANHKMQQQQMQNYEQMIYEKATPVVNKMIIALAVVMIVLCMLLVKPLASWGLQALGQAEASANGYGWLLALMFGICSGYTIKQKFPVLRQRWLTGVKSYLLKQAMSQINGVKK